MATELKSWAKRAALTAEGVLSCSQLVSPIGIKAHMEEAARLLRIAVRENWQAKYENLARELYDERMRREVLQEDRVKLCGRILELEQQIKDNKEGRHGD